MLEIYAKIIESDAIILGTPVYWYGPTALMKAFIDRFVYFNCPENRAKIRGKPAVLVIPFEEESPEIARPVVEFFQNCLKYLELNLLGAIIAGGVSDKGDVLKKPQYAQHVPQGTLRAFRRLAQTYELGCMPA